MLSFTLCISACAFCPTDASLAVMIEGDVKQAELDQQAGARLDLDAAGQQPPAKKQKVVASSPSLSSSKSASAASQIPADLLVPHPLTVALPIKIGEG